MVVCNLFSGAQTVCEFVDPSDVLFLEGFSGSICLLPCAHPGVEVLELNQALADVDASLVENRQLVDQPSQIESCKIQRCLRYLVHGDPRCP
ncbi:hypothetical protein RER_24650 [Rhodococcus erythropolis PR4]|uniref:Uncharacterized protein n=1 Tax=Rhodococcus erythropolis (strain PR4 / NBRC 100887) TaxID=234621 RepID=C0ZXT8_RHOE4|nr:hypothetical protein RER_24650 [Rhodococcus erythropolis PR4]